MKLKLLLILSITCISIASIAQNVGIGTNNPSTGAKLDIQASDNGILIPRVALVATNDTAPIVGVLDTSLLVYNTTTNSLVKPGFYYWDGRIWDRLLVSRDSASVDNGLEFTIPGFKTQLGGNLIKNTTITQGDNDMIFNLNSNGDFIIQDDGINHFEIRSSGNSVFGGDSYWQDESTNGSVLATLTDFGDDGVFQVFRNGNPQHSINGGAITVFNEQGVDNDFRIESNANTDMFRVDAANNRVGIGTSTPQDALHVVGTSAGVTSTAIVTITNFADAGDTQGASLAVPANASNVTVTIEGAGDLDGVSETFTVFFNGTQIGGVLNTGVQDCTYRPVITNQNVSASALPFSGGNMPISVTSSPATNTGFSCVGAIEVRMTFTFTVPTTSARFENGTIRIDQLGGSGTQMVITDANGDLGIQAIPANGDITGITAGDGLSGGGTTGDITVTANANNGLNVDVGADAIQLGGALTENTTIAQGTNTMDFTTSVIDGFSVDGTTFSVDGASNKVGIGTATPQVELDVNGTILAGGRNATHHISTLNGFEGIIVPGTTSDYLIHVQDGSGRVQHKWNATYGTAETFIVGNEDAFFMDITGNANTDADVYFEIKHDDGDGVAAGDPIAWNTHLAITQGGNVGIGTATPVATIDVRGDAVFNEDGGDFDFRVESDANANMLFVDAGLNRIGIGTATPDNALDVNGKITISQSFNDEMVIINDDIWSHGSAPNLDFGVGGDYLIVASRETGTETNGFFGDGNYSVIWNPGDNNRIVRFLDEDGFNDGNTDPFDNNAEEAYIDGAGAYVQASDKNRKENITKITGALNAITNVNGYTYNYKLHKEEIEKGDIQLTYGGVIAQEIEKVFPYAVQTDEYGGKFVHYDGLSGLFIEAIKEQQEIINKLQEQLDLQQKQINELLLVK